MTDVTNRNRQSAGQPIGGQFATEAKGTDTGVSLGGPVDHGGWNAPGEGSRSPWGTIDHAQDIAPGIVSVGTPSHGGVRLSPERNREVPTPLRQPSGWYEEDCEAYIPQAIFADEFAAERRNRLGSKAEGWGQTDFVRDQSEARVREWFPDQWEQWRGQQVQPGQSLVRDRQNFDAEHADDHVTVSAITSDDHPGMVEVTATRGGQRSDDRASVDERTYLVPTEEYRDRGEFPFVIDPDRHTELTEQRPEAFTPPPSHRMTDGWKALPNGRRSKVLVDLNKRWRGNDGEVKTMEEMIDDGEVTGKKVTVENGRRTYSLTQQTGPSTHAAMPVSKETWEAFGAPDTRTEADHAREAVQIARTENDRAEGGSGGLGGWGFRNTRDSERAMKARKKLEKAEQRYAAAKKAETGDDQ